MSQLYYFAYIKYRKINWGQQTILKMNNDNNKKKIDMKNNCKA